MLRVVCIFGCLGIVACSAVDSTDDGQIDAIDALTRSANSADLVVYGTARIEATRWHEFPEGRVIVTEYAIRTEGGSEITVMTVGGTLDGVSMESSVEPRVDTSNPSLFFLAGNDRNVRFAGPDAAIPTIDGVAEVQGHRLEITHELLSQLEAVQ